MQSGPPICWACKHFFGREEVACKAFPKGIPQDIYYSGAPHDLPVKGDGGIRFESTNTPEANEHLASFTRKL
jgi:hypothetical protein